MFKQKMKKTRVHFDPIIIGEVIEAMAKQESALKGHHLRGSLLPDLRILKAARQDKGMTQQQVADMAKINIRHYQVFEPGERDITNASFRIAMTICKVLGIEPERLFDLHGAPDTPP